ncbi:ACT domain-containing protein [Chitinimonas sp.]|uniref:ACT domain-containing protein n=1 Tax=Chitinimonas sp. TaxID=1934313 RepID=UPI0035B18BE4
MRKQLTLSLENQVGALERLLRVVRHRGYAVKRFDAHLPDDQSCLQVCMEVESDRLAFSLVAQLAKLSEVRSLSMRGEAVSVAH